LVDIAPGVLADLTVSVYLISCARHRRALTILGDPAAANKHNYAMRSLWNPIVTFVFGSTRLRHGMDMNKL